MTNHLFSLVRDGVPDPAKTVIETPEGRRYSYADLIARSGAYAAALRAAGLTVEIDAPDLEAAFLEMTR